MRAAISHGMLVFVPIKFKLKSIESSGGDTVNFTDASVTCIVGGNNAGKSQVLREIWRLVDRPEGDQEPLAVARLRVNRPSGTVPETTAWLESRMIRYDTSPGEGPRYASAPGRPGQTPAEIQRWFGSDHQGEAYLGNTSDLFVKHATAGSLASFAAGVVGDRHGGTASNAPLGRVFSDGSIEEALSNAVVDTFGHSLTLDRVSTDIRLRVGSVSVPVPLINRPTVEYAKAVSALPTLDAQGDGLRSFVGLALVILAERPDVLLIDEPEAFLHPGQARAVGRWISQQAATLGIQVVVATHDRDIVLGLIQGGDGTSVNVVRVSREGDRQESTRLAQLPHAEIEAVWANPVLRYSNVLQGLFHRQVVICEGDADCRFFGAALDALAIAQDKRALADDVLLIPSGGKVRIGDIAASVSRLRVESKAIVDFDLLRNLADVKSVVEGTGHKWTKALQDLYSVFVKSPNKKTQWDVLKKTGLAGMEPGDSYTAGVELIGELAQIGVYVVPVGEMEDFDKGTNLHGAAWVSEALERGIHKSASVQDLVMPILA